MAAISDFEYGEHLAGMITFGCNIPLFSFAYKEADLIPIKFPGSKLSSSQKEKSEWLNFYDPNDILGYPLAQLNNKFSFIKDKHINVEEIGTSWNPLTHSAYWTDDDFTEPAENL
ncbi:MAG: hypothetical protein ACI9Y1_002367 [Lentisphaeria bacterium]